VLARPREDQLGFQLERWFSPDFRAERPDEVQRVADIFLKTDSDAHATACRALGAFDGEHFLADIEADTLVVVGADDYATPPAMGKALAEGIPHAAYREIPAVRHMSLVEHQPLWDEIEAHFRRGTRREA
jgi:3-oxoadipate enol-lactonase